MKLPLRITLLSLFCNLNFAAFAQLDIKAPKDYTVHSPNVTSLGTYNAYPVDFATGVPKIDIPLYTVKSGKLSLPISISYHAGGVKVDQDASLIGLGWVLNAGGVITRTIKDRIDEDQTGFYYTGGTLPDYNSYYNVNGAGLITNNPTLAALYKQDKEPDIFNVVAPGLNDEFCLDNRHIFVSTHLDSLKYSVDFIANLLIVTDRAGNIYRFGKGLDNSEAFERTTTSSQTTKEPTQSNFVPYVSGWYLTEMISSDLADTISFKYTKRLFTSSRAVSSVRYVFNDDITVGSMDQNGTVFDDKYTVISNATIENLRIPDKVIFKNGSIEFLTAKDRLDLQDGAPPGVPYGNGTRITGFVVYDQQHAVLKKVMFGNDGYFDRTAQAIDILGYTIKAESKKSLRLNGVKVFDKNDVKNDEYKFAYDETPLPPRGTTSQDFWGYYNGKQNATMIPQTFYHIWNGAPAYLGDDRKTDINFMKAASLKRITFPTGGYTTYEFEPNYYLSQAASGGQVEVSKSATIYAINRQASCRPNYLPGVPANNSLDFQITNLSDPLAHLYVMFSDFSVSNGGGMTFDLYEVNSSGSIIGNSIAHYVRQPSSNTQPLVFNLDFQVYEGHQYRMIANTNGVTGSQVSLCNSPYIEAGVNWKSLEPAEASQVAVEQAGGLRIKSVNVFNNDDTLISKKVYEYGEGLFGANQVGVGRLITDPSHNFYNYPLLYRNNNSTYTLRNILWFTSESQVELGMNSGCPVDYSKVTVKDMSGTATNGKTEYFFQSLDGYHEPRSSFMYPYDFIVRPAWTVNNLIKSIIYKGTSEGSYIPVKKIENGYDVVEKRIKTLKDIEFQPDIYFGEIRSDETGTTVIYSQDNPKRFYRYNYFQARGKMLKTGEMVTDYINNGSDSIVIAKQYQYNPYYDLKQEASSDSKSRVVQTNYKYTGDVNYTNLIAKNAVSLPVQTEQVVAGKVRDGGINKYNDLAQLTEQYYVQGNPTPVGYTSFSSVPAYYERRTSYSYDADHQNIKTVTPEAGMPVIYIWSYKGQYPVAEIKGVSYSAVESALGGAVAVSNFRKSMPSDTQVNTFLSVLRTGLTDAQVVTYTYLPQVGISTKTDVKGEKTFFEYDSFQRLKTIKDLNGNILKSYQYNYRP